MKLQGYQRMIFVALFLGYACYSYNRKSVSFALPALTAEGLSKEQAGAIWRFHSGHLIMHGFWDPSPKSLRARVLRAACVRISEASLRCHVARFGRQAAAVFAAYLDRRQLHAHLLSVFFPLSDASFFGDESLISMLIHSVFFKGSGGIQWVATGARMLRRRPGTTDNAVLQTASGGSERQRGCLNMSTYPLLAIPPHLGCTHSSCATAWVVLP
ncbi:unnamed protein product, partial [Ixodes pacificus]